MFKRNIQSIRQNQDSQKKRQNQDSDNGMEFIFTHKLKVFICLLLELFLMLNFLYFIIYPINLQYKK